MPYLSYAIAGQIMNVIYDIDDILKIGMLPNFTFNCMITVFHLQNATVKGFGNNQEKFASDDLCLPVTATKMGHEDFFMQTIHPFTH